MDEHKSKDALSAAESKLLVQSGYDQIAPTYLEWTTATPSPRLEYLEKLFSYLKDPSNANVLELGCGAGVPCSIVLAERCAHLIANDISQAQIDMAKERVPKSNVEFVKADMTTLSFEPSSFHAVVAYYSILHLPRDEQKTMAAEILKWLSPGGYVVCNFGIDDNPGSSADWLGSKMYWSSFDTETYLQILKDIGYRIVESEVRHDNEDGRMVPFLWILANKDGSAEEADRKAS
jgi:ubiquinone/menaquinone biosynthesis C-methylase UbiE